MRVNLYATFRLAAHVKSFDIDLPPGTTVRASIEAIAERYPVLRPHWLDESGDLHAHVHVFLNGDDIATLSTGLDTPLQPTDTLDFFPPVAGG
jgi:sulfur-carrier protein